MLIDFGAAKEDFVRHTKSSAPHTQGYAAIEQMEADGKLGPWTDLYGLGAVLWRIVAGGHSSHEPCVPADPLSRMAARFRGQEDPLPSARKLGAGRFSGVLLEAIDKCLELEPTDRLENCGQLRGLLSVLLDEGPIKTVPNRSAGDGIAVSRREPTGGAVSRAEPLAEPGAKRGRIRRALRGTLVGLAATLMVLVVAGLLWYGGRTDRRGSGDSEPEVESVDIERLRERAEQHDPEAQRLLGWMYVEGDGVPQDHADGAKWLRKAAEQDDRQAQRLLGGMYFFGKGVPQDYAEAEKWFRKAAEQDDSPAQALLGGMYFNGKGVPQDYAEAEKWFRKAAEQDDSPAQALLGGMYFNGKGVPQDYAEAAKWFRKAAEQDNSPAQARLGEMYFNGKGVPQDYAEGREVVSQGGRAG